MIKNRIITLLTDFGLQDPFVGIMKGVILNIIPNAHIIDISHNIRSHNILEGAFVLFQSYSYFPKGTTHIAVVDPGVGSNRKKLIIKTSDYMFVVPDNGIASLITDIKEAEIFEITNRWYFLNDVSDTFHGRDIFAPVGAYLAKGVKPEKISTRIKEIETLSLPNLEIKGNRGIGTVIYIDKFGNIITNIKKGCFNDIKSIDIKSKKITKVSKSYNSVEQGRILAIYGSSNLLEISMNKENAAEKMNIKIGDKINFDFA